MARNSWPGGPLFIEEDEPPAKPSWWRRKRPGRLTNGLVALSAAAIVSVYAVGYMSTSAQEGDLGGVAAAAPAMDSAPTPTVEVPNLRQQRVQGVATPPATSTPRQQQAPAATPTPSSSSNGAAAAVGYKDGSYVGVGNSRHGSIEATVVISGGKITSASVSGCGTRYSCSKVNLLVNEVVTIQAAPMHYISGATDSSQAYRGAIMSALSQARA